MKFRTVHRLSALVLAIYICLHVANHIIGLQGVDSHVAFMRAARLAYRHPLVEVLLILAFVFQMISGAVLVARQKGCAQGQIARIRNISGIYLLFFLLIHISAVMLGRSVFELDTNFYFAAAGMHVFPFQFFFAPYYFLAVVALFTHIGCAAYYSSSFQFHVRKLVLVTSVGAGCLVGTLIMLSLAGILYPIAIPVNYTEVYRLTVSAIESTWISAK